MKLTTASRSTRRPTCPIRTTVHLVLALGLGAVGSGAAAAQAGPSAAPAATDRLLPVDGSARAWVDSVLAGLDLRGRAAQMVMPWTSGRYVATDTDEWRALEAWVAAGVGGFVVSIGQPVVLADKLNRLQRAARVPLLMAADMENGPGMRLNGGVLLPSGMELGGGTMFPPTMAVGATGDPAFAYAMGRVTAREGRAVGIHVDFAPVVDVNNNPLNPVINTRSYGADPERVARFGAAQVRGLQDHGMLATAKHFPGHGDTSGDTHLELQVLRIDRARADSVELVPYRAAIDAGVSAVMSAHVAFPALTGDPSLPATLSGRMLDSLLVRELGFEGLVVTDALRMGAIVRGYGGEEAAVLALEAGADVLLQMDDPLAVIDAVVAAVEAGRVSEARIERSARKILEAKARVGLHLVRTVDVDAVAGAVESARHAVVAERIAERSITLVRDRDGVVPLEGPGPVLSITYSDDVSPFAADAFHDVLAPQLPGLTRVRLQAPVPAVVLDSVVRLADAADRVLFVSDVRVRSGKGSVAVEPAVAEALTGLAARRPVLVVSLGNPYLLQQIPEAGGYLVAWGSQRPSQEAAARALLGHAPITGRLPIPIPPLHEAGDGLDRGPALAALDSTLEAATRGGVMPGAVLAMGRSAGTTRLIGHGATDPAPGAPPATASTIFDMASLTKVVGTTSAVMLLVDRGVMELDAPLSRYLPEWPRGGWRDSVTIRLLLTHRSGLPAFLRFWHPSEGAQRGRAAYLAAIARTERGYQPGERTVYSDLGFILLGAAVESVTGMGLDAFLDQELWRPLGMRDTGFNPRPDRMETVWREADPTGAGDPGAAVVPVPLERIAPTEVDTVFRHAHVHGVVHDENAFAMGGVAGHAGLFSTAPDLARFARMLLRGGVSPDGRRIVSEATVRRFTARDPGGDRALGWDPAPGSGRIGEPFSADGFGHTGFTGTSFWVDPARDLFVILLTNRVNPTRDGPSITPVRRAVHGLAVEAVGGAPRGVVGGR